MKFTAPILAAIVAAPVMADAWMLGRSPLTTLLSPTLLDPPMIGPRFRTLRRPEPGDWGITQVSPRYEITNNDEVLKIAIDAPGLKPEDINVSIDDDNQVISISGHRESSSENYQFKSRFSQSFYLDPAVDVEKFSATLNNGVLIVSAPKDMKRLEAGVRNIPVMQGSDAAEEKIESAVPEEGVPIEVKHEEHKEEPQGA